MGYSRYWPSHHCRWSGSACQTLQLWMSGRGWLRDRGRLAGGLTPLERSRCTLAKKEKEKGRFTSWSSSDSADKYFFVETKKAKALNEIQPSFSDLFLTRKYKKINDSTEMIVQHSYGVCVLSTVLYMCSKTASFQIYMPLRCSSGCSLSRIISWHKYTRLTIPLCLYTGEEVHTTEAQGMGRDQGYVHLWKKGQKKERKKEMIQKGQHLQWSCRLIHISSFNLTNVLYVAIICVCLTFVEIKNINLKELFFHLLYWRQFFWKVKHLKWSFFISSVKCEK